MTAATISTFAGLMIKPKRVFAAWPKESFDITDLGQSIKSVYGHNNLEENSKVKLKVPDIAENGAIVPINVKTTLDNVESIMLFVENNPNTFMPPFGKHGAITKDEINKIIEYLYTL